MSKSIEEWSLDCLEHLDDLWSPEVTKGKMPDNDGDDPFNQTFFVTFTISNDELKESDDTIWDMYYLPCVNFIAKECSTIDMIRVPLTHPTPDSPQWARSEALSGRSVLLTWEKIDRGLVVEISTRFRHVGNHYRTIVNGPMHRLQMPFKEEPKEGAEFEHRYSSWEGSDYDQLPELSGAAIVPVWTHKYRTDSRYCYYLGERGE